MNILKSGGIIWMNRDRLNQIINVLLLPYCGNGFEKNDGDWLKNVRSAVYKFRYSLSEGKNARERAEKNYFVNLKRMEEYISKDSELRTKTIDDIKLLLELFFPEDEILTLMDNYKNPNLGIEKFYIKNLFRIAESLLTFRDGRIAIRTWMNSKSTEIFKGQNIFDKVEIWNILCRGMVPDIFIAAFFILSDMNEPRFLYNQNGGITLADKVLDKVLIKGFAETHMHMNAGIEYSVLWEGTMTYRYWLHILDNEKNYEKKYLQLYLFIYRILYAGYLREKNKTDNFLKYLKIKFPIECYMNIVKLLDDMYTGKESLYDSEYEEILTKVCMEYIDNSRYFNEKKEFLIQTVYSKERCYKTSAEMIFLMESIDYVANECKDEFEIHLFLQYLRFKNKYFRKVIQKDNVLGLNNFQQYFGNAKNVITTLSKINEKNIWKQVFKSQSHNISLKKMEIRISPNIFFENIQAEKEGRLCVKLSILRKIKLVLESYISYIREMTGESLDSDLSEKADKMYQMEQCAFPGIGIIFHFIKADYLENRIGDMCWLQYSEEWKGLSKHLLIWRKKLVECAECIEELRSTIPYLAEYIVGIDAASEENTTEPWIMAPVYKAVRNKRITKALLLDKNMQIHRIDNLGFTYHVGEEFRHVLSGLRHIDEVIEEFDYKAGDRLGHAIALGEDIDFWIRDNEVVTIPIMEWMENLLWVWGNIVQARMKLDISATYLEGKIMELAQEIYDDSEGMTPLMLYQAYKSKFLLNHSRFFEKQKECITKSIENTKNTKERRIFCKFYGADKEQQRWTKDKITCTFFCPVYNMRFRKPILVRTAENLGVDVLNSIQKYLIQKVEFQGIYVETNPTSNIEIGQKQGLMNHYVLKLNSEGLLDEAEKTNAVMVTVNSDDPIVFNTSIDNELAYIYYLLVHKKYKKERVLRWIDKVRENSLESSFIKNAKMPSRQLAEMNSIIDDIDDFIKNART